jgi:hypothetical protein
MSSQACAYSHKDRFRARLTWIIQIHLRRLRKRVHSAFLQSANTSS